MVASFHRQFVFGLAMAVSITSLAAAPLAEAQDSQEPSAAWQAGFATVDITPEFPVGMAGYGGRDHQATTSLTKLFAKALALRDASGNTSILITLDLVGIHRSQSMRLRRQLAQSLGLDPSHIMIACSHTHTGPVVGRNLAAMHYWTLEAPHQQAVDRYEEQLDRQLIQVATQAHQSLAPAKLSWGMGSCDVAVNRRNNSEPEVPQRRADGALVGPIDHRVPVMAIHDLQDSLIGIVFGYACHATVLSSNEWSGDYPGFAQATLEARFAGATAMFWAGCGADQNPLPRRTPELARHYGERLATSVEAVLRTHAMSTIAPHFKAMEAEIDLPLDANSDPEVWKPQLEASDRFVRGRARAILENLDEQGQVPTSYPYPIAVWSLGSSLGDSGEANEPGIAWVFLGGEVVVDYSLRLREWEGESLDSVWVAAYSNDVMAYIPSRRVLGEGGYEGGGAMLYYGLPGPWKETVEEEIWQALNRLREQLGKNVD